MLNRIGFVSFLIFVCFEAETREGVSARETGQCYLNDMTWHGMAWSPHSRCHIVNRVFFILQIRHSHSHSHMPTNVFSLAHSIRRTCVYIHPSESMNVCDVKGIEFCYWPVNIRASSSCCFSVFVSVFFLFSFDVIFIF